VTIEADPALRDLLAGAHAIAVLGAKADPAAEAQRIPLYLESAGYTVLRVNPKLSRRGEASFLSRLADLPAPVDLIDVFRASANIPAHVEEILALPWRPRAVWLQLGVRDDASAARLEQHGIAVVQDRCILREHLRLLGGEEDPDR